MSEIAMLQQLPTDTVRMEQSAVLNLGVEQVLSATPNIPFSSRLCEPPARD